MSRKKVPDPLRFMDSSLVDEVLCLVNDLDLEYKGCSLKLLYMPLFYPLLDTNSDKPFFEVKDVYVSDNNYSQLSFDWD